MKLEFIFYFTRLIIIFILFILSWPISAALTVDNALTVLEDSCACISGTPDPLEDPIKFNFGAFKGQCIDSCRNRNIHVISRSNQAFEIANVLHLGKFWNAKIPQNVEKIEIGFERFSPFVNHVFLRFQFAPSNKIIFSPLKKAAVTHRDSQEPRETTQALVLSIEGVTAQKMDYALSSAYFGNYLIAYRMISAEEAKSFMVDHKKHKVEFYDLNLNPRESNQVLERAIDRASSRGLQEIYALFTKNCATEAYELIKDLRQNDQGMTKMLSSKFLIPLPISGPLGTKEALRHLEFIN